MGLRLDAVTGNIATSIDLVGTAYRVNPRGSVPADSLVAVYFYDAIPTPPSPSALTVSSGPPWIGIETMITRQKPGGSEETFGPSQAVTIEEAIEIFTINAARQEGMADRVGRIAVGMVADVIVVDRNPFEVSKYEIHQVVVEQTIINGEIVFDRNEKSGD